MLHKFKTFQLATQFYQLCQLVKLPHHLKDQLLRASSSVALNLCEGSGKKSLKDKKRFYNIAYGSIRECQGLLIIAQVQDAKLIDLADHIGACIYKLSQ